MEIVALELILLVGITVSIIFYIWGAICITRFKIAQRPHEKPLSSPVSLLIPVCGLDSGAYENWLSVCQQDYEHYEVLFGVMNPEDPAVPILKEIVEKFSHASLHFCLEVRGVNHQISNLMHLLEKAQHEIVIFADSDIRVTPDYLSTVTAPLSDAEVGVVTCGYLDSNPSTLGAALASLGRAIDFLPSVLIARTLDGTLKFAIGPTIVTRKSVLAKFGGLQKVVNRIGSDYHIGNMAANAGYRVELSKYILENDCTNETFSSVYKRELRWSRTIRINRGFQYYGMVFCYGTLYCIPLLFLAGFAPWSIAVCLLTWTVRLIQILLAFWTLNGFKLGRWLWVLPLREMMSFSIWLRGCFGQRVYWRGRWLKIYEGGTLKESS